MTTPEQSAEDQAKIEAGFQADADALTEPDADNANDAAPADRLTAAPENQP